MEPPGAPCSVFLPLSRLILGFELHTVLGNLLQLWPHPGGARVCLPSPAHLPCPGRAVEVSPGSPSPHTGERWGARGPGTLVAVGLAVCML